MTIKCFVCKQNSLLLFTYCPIYGRVMLVVKDTPVLLMNEFVGLPLQCTVIVVNAHLGICALTTSIPGWGPSSDRKI